MVWTQTRGEKSVLPASEEEVALRVDESLSPGTNLARWAAAFSRCSSNYGSEFVTRMHLLQASGGSPCSLLTCFFASFASSSWNISTIPLVGS